MNKTGPRGRKRQKKYEQIAAAILFTEPIPHVIPAIYISIKNIQKSMHMVLIITMYKMINFVQKFVLGVSLW